MGLRVSKGNMYEFVSHTFNVVKGECYHNCSYCFMKKWGRLNPMRFDRNELKTNLGEGNFIFVGSSCDMFASNVSSEWIAEVLAFCDQFDNRYLLQSKNPERYEEFSISDKFVLGTTIESDRYYPLIYGNSPEPFNRALAMGRAGIDRKSFVTIEPVLDFDVQEFVYFLREARPNWISIGADSGNNKLPEPSPVKLSALISALNFTEIRIKKNLRRLLGRYNVDKLMSK